MNAINHAATALLINRRWPGVPLIPVLVSVQLIEVAWVVLNLAGIEMTDIAPEVNALNDIHLTYMPYSHSVASSLVVAAAVWLVVAKVFGRAVWAVALAAGVASHIVLDLATHAADIQLAPGIALPKLGTGLYEVPLLALCIETAYGIWCWWVFRGSRALLSAIVILNLATLSFYSGLVPGPEGALPGHPTIFAVAIGVHIVLGWVVVGVLARPHWRPRVHAGA
jgi:hypothetical protein